MLSIPFRIPATFYSSRREHCLSGSFNSFPDSSRLPGAGGFLEFPGISLSIPFRIPGISDPEFESDPEFDFQFLSGFQGIELDPKWCFVRL